MSYTLFASESTVHVLSPTEVVDAVRATVMTPTHSVIAASIVPETNWGTEIGLQQLRRYSYGVDWLIDNTAAMAAIGTQSIDANGLLQQNVTYTVAYTPPGSTTGPLTIQVDIPNTLLEQPGVGGAEPVGLQTATQLIAQAEASLRTMAAG